MIMDSSYFLMLLTANASFFVVNHLSRDEHTGFFFFPLPLKSKILARNNLKMFFPFQNEAVENPLGSFAFQCT